MWRRLDIEGAAALLKAKVMRLPAENIMMARSSVWLGETVWAYIWQKRCTWMYLGS